MPGFGFQRSCCLYYPMGFLVYVMRWWRVRFWPIAAIGPDLSRATLADMEIPPVIDFDRPRFPPPVQHKTIRESAPFNTPRLKDTPCYCTHPTTPCAVAYACARIRRLTRLWGGRYRWLVTEKQ